MPTNRFSTRSTRPIPCLPPNLLSVRITPKGLNPFPFTARNFPFRNPDSRTQPCSARLREKRSTCTFVCTRAPRHPAMDLPECRLRRKYGGDYGPSSKASWRSLLPVSPYPRNRLSFLPARETALETTRRARAQSLATPEQGLPPSIQSAPGHSLCPLHRARSHPLSPPSQFLPSAWQSADG